MNKPLLSIVTTNKNDQYFENQLLRTKFIINYFVYSTKKMNAVNKVEYIIVDWGSDEPFSNYFHKEISMCASLKFINVPREETEKCKLSFDTTKATNIGINNSSAEYIMITGSDQFFPLSVFNNLLNFLEKPEEIDRYSKELNEWYVDFKCNLQNKTYLYLKNDFDKNPNQITYIFQFYIYLIDAFKRIKHRYFI